MPYVDPLTVHDPVTGAVAPAAWGDVLRDDLEFLIAPPSCNVFNSSTQSVANTTATILTANSERYDTDGMHSTVTNTSRVTFQTDGVYELAAAIGVQGDIDGIRQIAFLINGTTQSIRWRHGPGTSGDLIIPAYYKNRFTAADYAEVQFEHSAGAALNVTLHEFTAKYDMR